MSGQFEFIACRDCGQKIVRRGRRRINVIGKTIDHDLSCPARPTQPEIGPTTSASAVSAAGHQGEMMSAPTFEDFVAPVNEDSDPYPPKDNYNKPLLVKVREHKEGIVTSNSPDGAPGVIVDLVDLSDGKIYRNTLWMGGAVVDGLKQYVGKVLVIRFESRKSNSGRTYPAPIKASDEDKTLATRYYDSKGDPFKPQFTDLADDIPF